MDAWALATGAYCTLAIGSFVPVARTLLASVDPQKVKLSIESAHKEFDAAPLSETDKAALRAHFARLAGTLIFWKLAAEKYKRVHYYCLWWTIPSAVVIPIIAQAIGTDPWSKALVTIVSGQTAVLLALHRGFKVEDNFKAFRHGESEFYDLWRRLLDRPLAIAASPVERIDKYFEETEKIRRFVRNAETSNLATLDEARQMLTRGKDGEARPPPDAKSPR
jgi:hypothetical protein